MVDYHIIMSRYLSGAPTALFFHTGSNRLFCGCESGLIHVRKQLSLFEIILYSFVVGISCWR